jgi:hypothetical protein
MKAGITRMTSSDTNDDMLPYEAAVYNFPQSARLLMPMAG